MTIENNLVERLQILEDIEAIKQLKARWWFACDVRDTGDMRSCYHEPDFLIDFGFIGQYRNMEEFIRVFEELACHPSHIDMHHGMSPEIQLTGEASAKGRWRMQFQLLETEKKMVQMMHGYYDDEYVKVDGEWKISVSRYTILSNLLMQAGDGSLQVLQLGAAPGLVTESEG
ncbi:MAG: nuclear transport factor 2 family protein [Gammaproteobacteria bacterium]|uniref:nuclear transport factor 2 family protein n=1 Tax=Pseudomaricurvus alcaniphilus TaxID=1166482 RepID=UPI00140BD224|nr:nuclear transport factor 2 family protein [Pseudomaricurvus alcaniphilus]MBR9911381.1 nuclear transport factor 2 family protein [Gammaproteobacteria bacterium]NHN36829.1 nuclear transport factor 2 family protein [Pseudomaricurvus alcaniphilus]